MTKLKYSSPKHGINIYCDNDGFITCSGTFEGSAIISAVPLDNGARCVFLLDPDGSTAPVFENLLCIDRAGNVVWRASLPTSPDVFLSAVNIPEGILAKTWSGMSICLDRRSGIELSRSFVK